jgi:hypothetical protein
MMQMPVALGTLADRYARFAAVEARGSSPPPAPEANLFLLSLDGKPLAWTGPHGQSIHWFGS